MMMPFMMGSQSFRWDGHDWWDDQNHSRWDGNTWRS
jgi:hypothetical protein